MKVFIYDNGYNLTNYLSAVKALGHLPTLSKNLSDSNDKDVLILTGGGNIHPYFYGENCSDFEIYDTLTDICEFYLLNKFVKENKRVIGVCKGMQIINVYFGGSVSFLNSEEKNVHYSFNKDVSHKIILKDQSTITVNSQHKQKINRLGENLHVEAVSEDGVIECIKHNFLKIIGVQFHPERLDALSLYNFYNYFFNF